MFSKIRPSRFRSQVLRPKDSARRSSGEREGHQRTDSRGVSAGLPGVGPGHPGGSERSFAHPEGSLYNHDMDAQGEQFVSEPIQPVAGTGRASSAAIGEPGLPGQFAWRGETYRVVGVLKKWKRSGPCRHGSGEMYLRRHYYRIRTDPAKIMTLYCDRQARNRSKPKARWFVYTVSEVDASGGPADTANRSDRLQAAPPDV